MSVPGEADGGGELFAGEELPQPVAAAIISKVKTKAACSSTYGVVRIIALCKSGSRKQENITTSQIGELAAHFRGGEFLDSTIFIWTLLPSEEPTRKPTARKRHHDLRALSFGDYPTYHTVRLKRLYPVD